MLQAVKAAGDVVFIAGDVRNAAGEVVAAEIVGSSISSASNAELTAATGGPAAEPADQQEARKANSGWSYLDSRHHGYVLCEASPTTFKATMKNVATIKQRSRVAAAPVTFTVNHGKPGLAA